MTLPLSSVTPSVAAQAYQRGEKADAGLDTNSFGAAMQSALGSAVDAGHAADAQATGAVLGHANATDVVTAVSKAELALQTTVAIRDRVVQAYQDIMRMPI